MFSFKVDTLKLLNSFEYVVAVNNLFKKLFIACTVSNYVLRESVEQFFKYINLSVFFYIYYDI